MLGHDSSSVHTHSCRRTYSIARCSIKILNKSNDNASMPFKKAVRRHTLWQCLSLWRMNIYTQVIPRATTTGRSSSAVSRRRRTGLSVAPWRRRYTTIIRRSAILQFRRFAVVRRSGSGTKARERKGEGGIGGGREDE